MALPCGMDRLWPLPQGLLLERERRQGGKATDEESVLGLPAELPVLFSLSHPLEEVSCSHPPHPRFSPTSLDP